MLEPDNQKDLIRSENWDYLIILDGCRFDFFESIHGEFLKGNLRRVSSAGTDTPDWFRNLFGVDKSTYGDVVYLSANPFINSYRGLGGKPRIQSQIGLRSSSAESKRKRGRIYPRKIFHKVIDVWDYRWDENIRTVAPEAVTEEAFKITTEYSDKRFIIHYLQPHYPYLCFYDRSAEISKEESPSSDSLKKAFERVWNFFPRRDSLWEFLKKVVGSEVLWKVRSFFGVPPFYPREVALRKSIDVLAKAYACNLRRVLVECEKLAKKLSGNLIVTSDHGELLGENGEWGHLVGLHLEEKEANPALLEVPWLKI
ncbi:hypothetical protein AKJ45_00215 [candidate division MSBL1 archaeon SCGC-AAA261F19]|uniref:Sulfatase N-terminal domain-containing protein n=1 Tax=candidate division MSBL1 archaeon SCGC-AAA261F19 TaxID=1698275 RepID=A0A133VBK2_9EURY|nr:hypothetical protein AKJ45_00215 [candidate division MSBL1 archaeon SCGC-AAA261F19]